MRLRLPFILASSFCCASTLAQEAPNRFRVQVDAVLVDALVEREGQPATGLTADDFELFDDGVRQPIDLLSTDLVRLNAFLILDTSKSVQGENLRQLRAAGHAFINALAERDQAGVLTFSHILTLRAPLTSDRARAHEALDRADAGGGTSLYDALFSGLVMADAPMERVMVLAFTDGGEQHSRLTTEEIRQATGQLEAVLYVVGLRAALTAHELYLGSNRNIWQQTNRQAQLLREVAEGSGGRYLEADSSANLTATFLRILKEMKDRYLLSFTPTPVPRAGWHRIEVKLKRHRAEVRTRRGYYVPSTPR